MKTLSITSPLTRGSAVTAAQRKLNGSNTLKQDFLQGAVDGVFGEETGRACRRAKYWLGYPEDEIEPIYGTLLDGLLDGANLPALYSQARGARLEAAQRKPLRAKALTEARKHLGVKEFPAGSNEVRFSKWYGRGPGPWCAMFVSWCYVQAGSKAFAKGVHYAYVPYIIQDGRAGRNGLAVTKTPLAGDLVCFDWQGDGVYDHIGLFDKWLPAAEGSEWYSVEGNTAIGNDSNGGEVMRRHRERASSRPVFVRVGR
jgi:peptidoglycan hydrolase-like protein with peptidoglycan-binding domain